MAYDNSPMDYYKVLSMTVLATLMKMMRMLVCEGGAIHIGTNRAKTSIQIKVFRNGFPPYVVWVNNGDDADAVLNELLEYLFPKSGQTG